MGNFVSYYGELYCDKPVDMPTLDRMIGNLTFKLDNININIIIDLLISYKVHRSLSKGTHLTAFAVMVMADSYTHYFVAKVIHSNFSPWPDRTRIFEQRPH